MTRVSSSLALIACLAAADAAHAQTATADDADLRATALALFEPVPLAPDPAPAPEKVELGKALFFEPRLSEGHNISCTTCHNLDTGGVDLAPFSTGHRWQQGGRNSPTVLNAVYNIAQFWDGRGADLVEQAGGPMQNPVEMG